MKTGARCTTVKCLTKIGELIANDVSEFRDTRRGLYAAVVGGKAGGKIGGKRAWIGRI